jgi:GNAT superfamily N-acetyltransferase
VVIVPEEIGESSSTTVETHVRLARSNDAVTLGNFFVQAWREAGTEALGFTGATEENIEEIASKEFLTRSLKNPRMRIVIAKRGRRILGFASLRLMRRGKAELSGVVVRESEVGKGLGTRLVTKASDVAIELGITRMIVKTEVFNRRAIRFYVKNGFVKTARATERVGKTTVPAQVLEKNLLPNC